MATRSQKIRFLDALPRHGLPRSVYKGGTYEYDPKRKDAGPSLLASVAFGDPAIVRYLLGSSEAMSKQMHFFLEFEEWHPKAVHCNTDTEILNLLTQALHQTSSGMQFERAIGLAAFKGRSMTLEFLLSHALPTALADPGVRFQIVMSFLSGVRYWSNVRPIAHVPTVDTFCECAGRGTRYGTLLHTFCVNLLRFDKREENDPPNKRWILFPEVYPFLYLLAQKGCNAKALDDRCRTPMDLLQGDYMEMAEWRGADRLEDRRPALGVAMNLIGQTFINWHSLLPPSPLPSCGDCRAHWALGSS